MKKKLSVAKSLYDEICAQAQAQHPKECCGFILGPTSDISKLTEVVPAKNVQDDFHKQDPERFQRTAETAYFIDPKDLFQLEKRLRENDEKLRIIYHSHVNVGAYFSEEDKKNALFDGVPVYPDVDYIVFSVREHGVDDAKVFSWDDHLKDFIEGVLELD